MSSPSEHPRPSLFEDQLRARQKRTGRALVGGACALGVLAIGAGVLGLMPKSSERSAAGVPSESAASAAARSPGPGAPASGTPTSPGGTQKAAGNAAPALAMAAQAGRASSAPVSANGQATGPAKAPQASRPAASKPDGLTAEQRAMLERMGGADTGAASVRAQTKAGQPPAKAAKGLSAAELSAVVARGRPSLQRCYESALRSSGSEQSVRVDISINVSAAGSVTRVSSRGASLPGMEACISRTVRGFRFPRASEATETQFPIVFQPGS